MFVVLRCWFVVGVLSSISVTGYSGGGVSITCKYERKYTENAKYFCRGQWSECTDQIKTEEKNKWVHSEIFSLYDDTRAAVFTVTIRDLSERDSGTYQCGVDIYAKVDSYTEVNLNVITGSANISCKYPQSHSADVKFVCRRSESDLCAEETSVKKSRRWSAEGQMQLYDDREQQLLTGTISHVTQQHSAEYWCGVQSDQGHKSFITRVLLSVTDVPKATPSLLPSSSTPPSSSSSSSSSSSVFKTSTSNFTSESPNMLKGACVINSNASIMIIFRAVNDFSVSLQVSHTGCDYEEIKYTHKQLPKTPSNSSNTVYATAQLPTNPSDLNYAVVNFHKKADCPDSVRLRNNQDYSEYAAVNHLTA
uniref:Ig-like domain-containing protein n=1 Tax=Sinocyclocheilus grahami TaxID=75366 RepID=A0A672MDS2_SINGR